MQFCIDCGHNHSLVTEAVEKVWNDRRGDWEFVKTKKKNNKSEWICVRVKSKECTCAKLVPRSFRGQFS